MRGIDVVYVLLVLCTALVVVFSYLEGTTGGSLGPGGVQGRKLRDVDVELIMRLFQEGRLSDREALYYRKLP